MNQSAPQKLRALSRESGRRTAAGGLVLPFYLGNIWFTLLVLLKPAGTLVQTLQASSA